MSTTASIELPGLDCGICGYRTCEELREQLAARPELIRRCIHLSERRVSTAPAVARPARDAGLPIVDGGCARPDMRPASGATAVARQPRPRVRFLPGALSRGAGTARDHSAP